MLTSVTDNQEVVVFHLVLIVVKIILFPLSASKKDILLWTLTVKKENTILHCMFENQKETSEV